VRALVCKKELARERNQEKMGEKVVHVCHRARVYMHVYVYIHLPARACVCVCVCA